MENKKIRVAITHGDTNGVGYEVILKLFAEPSILELFTPIVYGVPGVAEYHAKGLGFETNFHIIDDARKAQDNKVNMVPVSDDIKINLGEPTPESGDCALKAINKALEDYREGLFDVLVTAPVFKNNINGFNGHSRFLEDALGERQHSALTIMIHDDLRIALVTNNLAIKDVAESITKQKIVEKAKTFHQALRRDLRISSPRIAVLALNPRCGEDGVLGDEEQTVIIPAVEELAAQGLQVFGPYAADDFFGHSHYFRFDGILAMYHDQGQTPFKAMSSESGVRLTAGLPIVRTAPAHGVCYAAAGKGITDEQSLRNAIYTAIDVWRNRQNYDEPLSNPLPKLYHERRDDSEKVRFHKKPETKEGEE